MQIDETVTLRGGHMCMRTGKSSFFVYDQTGEAGWEFALLSDADDFSCTNPDL